MADADNLPILFSFRRCPYAMRARLALASCSMPVRLREVVLRDKPEALLTASPKGTVPVLLLQHGKVIEESREIMEWAFTALDPGGLFDGWHSASAKILIADNDGPFKQALDRYKYPDRYTGIDALAERQRASGFLIRLDRQLAERGGQLLRPAVSALDLAIFPFVRQFAHHDAGWFEEQDWPNLKLWLHGHLASPLFAAVMRKYPQWRPGDAEPCFPEPST